MFVIILTADDKCVLLNRENLRKPIQRQLYEKQKTFSELFSTIWKPRLNFEHFSKKDDSNSWCISEITDSE